ncbi:putative zinc-binding metallopeptidase [Amycolatopsis sp. NPDC021455]|uniref:putative zinc-binding metallopeptidase n=1 Tax=Amycolatopsis sp. NPDC021455 TaxID=3154901 RepID=UPI0033D5849E
MARRPGPRSTGVDAIAAGAGNDEGGRSPVETWAETFAHLLHIRDTVRTAAALGVLVVGTPIARTPTAQANALLREERQGLARSARRGQAGGSVSEPR